jgi:hypothetical protein
MAERTLEDFFDVVRSNQRANREGFPEWYAIIERIDTCFVRAGSGLVDPDPVMAAVLLLRCQYAFKAAAAMALAGQAAEAFPAIRSVLEYAGYCLVIAETPSLQSVFSLRHAGEVEKRAQKDAFQIRAVKDAVARRSAPLAAIYEDLYQRTIDFGAHPNPHAVFSTMKLDEREGKIMPQAITKDSKIMVHTFKSAGQVGLAALHVLECAYTSRFQQLGIHDELEAIANTGLL